MNRDCIESRIDCALEKARWQGMEVRSILLTKADHKALCSAVTRKYREETGSKARLHPLGYRGHIIRLGKQSAVYSTHGCEIAIPKLLSHRVAA